MASSGVIYSAYHKRFPIPKADFLLPIHVGRASSAVTKDGKIAAEELQWLRDHMIGDDTGDNISDRNREYCECTGLYWFWKNYNYSALNYVGAFTYRRQLILNDFFEKAADTPEKIKYKCAHLKRSKDVFALAGITEEKITELLSRYDCIVPYPSPIELINVYSLYEEYAKKISGVHITDLLALEDVLKSKHPDQAQKFRDYLSATNKMMYQIFITKPELFDDYCTWLFDLLFAVDPLVDSSLYTVNGRRTMGYLAELLYGFYFTHLVPAEKVLRTGVALLD